MTDKKELTRAKDYLIYQAIKENLSKEMRAWALSQMLQGQPLFSFALKNMGEK